MRSGVEFVKETGDMVAMGVKETAHLLMVDRLPGVKRLLKGYAHQGFLESYMPLRDGLHRMLHKALLERPATRLYFTGHSLGG